MGQTLDTGFSGNRLPFFGLGRGVIEGTLSVDEALEQAGLNWEVKKIPAGYAGSDGSFIEAGQKFWMTQRQDTMGILGQVGAQYGVFNNSQAFAFADELLGFGAEFHAAGSWNGGANVFLVAKLPEGIKVAGEEDMDLYLQMLNTHDGSGSIAWYATPIRIQCTNMNRLAISKAVSSAKIRHTLTAADRVEQAAHTLNLVDVYRTEMEAGIEALKAIDLELEQVENFFKEISDSERVQKNLMETYTTSESVTQGNGWGLINSITETLQWNPARNTGAETRFASNLDGPNQRTVERACRLLLRTR